MRKFFTFLLALAASVGMMNAKVTWNSSNISDLNVMGTNASYSKEGVTLSANADQIYAMWYSSGDESMTGIGFNANATGGFTFSNTLGKNFTKIEMLANRPGGWDWPDWGENADVPILDNAWYCLALEAAGEIAKIAHDGEYASYCDSLRNKVLDASRSLFWDGQCYRSPGHSGPPDDRANGMAVLAGFASPSQMEGISRALEGPRFASPYMEKYILESYFIRDDIEGGLARMRERYEEMVLSPLSTLWELWTAGNNSSINHGWAAGPLTLLSQYVAGISPVGPGWEKILARPQLGDLEWVECAVPVGDKTVNIHAAKIPGGMRLEIQNPTGRPCLVAVPENAREIKCNGKNYPAGSLSTVQNSLNGTNDGQKAIETDDRKVIVEYVYEN